MSADQNYRAVGSDGTSSPESRTTLILEPPLFPESFLGERAYVAVIEVAGAALVMLAERLDDGDISIYVGVRGWRYSEDGCPRNFPPHPLLAYRSRLGAWRVIDARVSTLLPKIDGALEDCA